jgi:hypothetical protein
MTDIATVDLRMSRSASRELAQTIWRLKTRKRAISELACALIPGPTFERVRFSEAVFACWSCR